LYIFFLTAKLLERQIERERARKVDEAEPVFTELKRENEEEKGL